MEHLNIKNTTMTNYLQGISADVIKTDSSHVFKSIAKEITYRQFEIIKNGKDNQSLDDKFPELKPIGFREGSRLNLMKAAKSLNKRG